MATKRKAYYTGKRRTKKKQKSTALPVAGARRAPTNVIIEQLTMTALCSNRTFGEPAIGQMILNHCKSLLADDVVMRARQIAKTYRRAPWIARGETASVVQEILSYIKIYMGEEKIMRSFRASLEDVAWRHASVRQLVLARLMEHVVAIFERYGPRESLTVCMGMIHSIISASRNDNYTVEWKNRIVDQFLDAGLGEVILQLPSLLPRHRYDLSKPGQLKIFVYRNLRSRAPPSLHHDEWFDRLHASVGNQVE